MPPKTKKASRIQKKASCIRQATTTVKLSRALQINSASFDADKILPEMSEKYTALVKKIKELDALDRRDHGTRFKHFIFTDMRESSTGAKALAAFMVAGGFEFQMKHGTKFIMRKGERVETKKGDTVLTVGEPVRHGNNGFAMLQSAPLWKNPLAISTKKDILRVFNSRPENVHGELLRIVILDSKYKEGIDLFDVKYVHFVEPPLANSDLKQALGRATRYCGQKGLRFMPNRGWPLHVFTYTTDVPGRAPYLDQEDPALYIPRTPSPKPPMLHTNTKMNVYGIFAHGMDLPEERRLRIPKGSMYVTLMGCGKTSYVWSQFGELFSDPDADFKGHSVKDILSNPLEHNDLLVELFRKHKLPKPHVHYYQDGPETVHNTYIDAAYHPAFTWDDKRERMSRSGVYELGDYTTDGLDKFPTFHSYYRAIPIKTIDDIQSMYKDSIHPTEKEITEYIKEKKLTTYKKFEKDMGLASNKFAIKQSQLFTKEPGVYYNPVCRDISEYNKPIAARIMSPEHIQYIDAHKLVLKYSGIDLGFLQLTQLISDLAIECAVDARLNRNINTKISMQLGGAVKLEKCFRRKSRHFPFSKTYMISVAKRMGLEAPKRAKREFFCLLMDKDKDYREALLKPISPKKQVEEAVLLPSLKKLAVAVVPIPEARIDTLAEIAGKRFDDFQEGITKMFQKYTWKRPVMENGCAAPEGAAAAPKTGIPITFNPTQEFIRHYLTPSSPFKGLLAWHSVGTGKTCTAIATASSSFEQEGYQILWVTRNALMSDVWKNIFGSVCSIPILEKLKAGQVIPDDLVDQKKMLSRAWLQPVSYRMFQNAMEKKNELGRKLYARNGKDPLHKTFLIIDEVHKLYDGDLLPAEAAEFSVIQSFIHKSYKTSGDESARVLLMSATPITDNPDQLFGILNTLRTDDYLPTFAEFRDRFCKEDTITEAGQRFFEERAKGLISYLNREFDPTTFAQPEFHAIRVPLGEMSAPDLKRIVDDCMPVIAGCEAGDMVADIAALNKDEMEKREYRKQVTAIRKRHKTMKKNCIKDAIAGVKQCYMTRKRLHTANNKQTQITALESCFGKPTPRPFVSLDKVKAEVERRVVQASERESIESTRAVRTPIR